jgi:basic membrane protein A
MSSKGGDVRKALRLRFLSLLLGAALLESAALGAGAVADVRQGNDKLDGLQVGLIMGGPKNDDGFYEDGFKGIKKARKKFGIEFTVIENVTPPDAEQAFRDLVDAGNELVIGMGADFEDGGLAVAPDYPDVQFVVMNGRRTLDNLATYQLREAQSAFLATYVVALIEDPGTTFGLIGGIEIPPHLTLRDGLEVALDLADKDDNLLATFTGSFTDVAPAREAAEAQIRNGATVLVPWSGSAVEGGFAAAENAGGDVNVISALVNHCGDEPYFIASAVTSPGGLVRKVISDFGKKNWEGDTSKALGLETPSVGKVVPCTELSPEVQQQFDDMKQMLIDGTVPGLPEGV